MQTLRLVLLYLRARWKVLFASFMCMGVLLVVDFLFARPLAPYLYAAALALACLVVLAVIDFTRFLRRHNTLLRQLALLDEGLYWLPPSRDLIQRDYQQIAHALEIKANAAVTDMEIRQREMEEYYAIWVHQIKTPIAALKLLLEGNAAASTELKKIEQYVEMALSYQKLQGLNMDFIAVNCPLDVIARDAVKRCAILFIQKNIRLTVELPHVLVLTDEKWLGFVIEQILTNAVKYTPAGGEVTIGMQPDEPSTLFIRDTGIGIRAEDLPRLGEKGFTGYNGHMDKRSTGIGLYLSKSILERLGHGIRFVSAPGKGTTVLLQLDRKKLDVE